MNKLNKLINITLSDMLYENNKWSYYGGDLHKYNCLAFDMEVPDFIYEFTEYLENSLNHFYVNPSEFSKYREIVIKHAYENYFITKSIEKDELLQEKIHITNFDNLKNIDINKTIYYKNRYLHIK